MKILNTNEFLSEKIMISPINLDDIYVFNKIDNMSFDDLTVLGNVALTTFNEDFSLSICVDQNVMRNLGIIRNDIEYELIRPRGNTGRISFDNAECWKEFFPEHRMFGKNQKILEIYKTNIDVTQFNSNNFESIYNDIVKQFKSMFQYSEYHNIITRIK